MSSDHVVNDFNVRLVDEEIYTPRRFQEMIVAIEWPGILPTEMLDTLNMINLEDPVKKLLEKPQHLSLIRKLNLLILLTKHQVVLPMNFLNKLMKI